MIKCSLGNSGEKPNRNPALNVEDGAGMSLCAIILQAGTMISPNIRDGYLLLMLGD